MQFFSVFSVLLSVFVISVNSAQWIAPPNKAFLKGRPDECYDSQFNLHYMKHRQVALPAGHCMKVVCLEDSSIIYYGCPTFGGCSSYQADNSKPYPACCPHCIEKL